MYREEILENFSIVKEAGKGMSRIERHAMNVDRAATKALPRLHCHTVKLEALYDKPIPMKKKAALENFYMVKEASKVKSLNLRGLKGLQKAHRDMNLQAMRKEMMRYNREANAKRVFELMSKYRGK